MAVSYVGDLGVGTVIVHDYGTLELLGTSTVIYPVRLPYVPTLLSFREVPPAVSAIRRLSLQSDVFWLMLRVGRILIDVVLPIT
jgi:deoxyinosine 3'endonuclease (endonuclease V)